MEGNFTVVVDDPDAPPKRPPPPPPKRLSRPKITLSIPETVATAATPATPRIPMTARGQVYWGPMAYHGKAPMTPASHVSDPHGNPYMNPFMHMYQNKASEFMFKQFAGFKDFTMNTAKSGLSAGEKSAFWFYNKLRTLSKKWFTHLFLTLCLVLYSVMGAAIFMAVEGTHEDNLIKQLDANGTLLNITVIRREFAAQIEDAIKSEIQPEWATVKIMNLLEQYDQNYTEYTKQPSGKTWSFWNSMFYAGTIYTTIG